MSTNSRSSNSTVLRGPSSARMKELLAATRRTRILVLGDVMLDHFLWGKVGRISPEAPVPVVDFDRESFIPGGAPNVPRNLTGRHMPTELFGAVGHDATATQLKGLLSTYEIGCKGLLATPNRH